MRMRQTLAATLAGCIITATACTAGERQGQSDGDKAAQQPPSAAPERQTPQAAGQPAVQQVLAGKKILMLIAPRDFRDEELAKPRAAFQRVGATVTVVSTKPGECTGMLGAKVNPDKTLDQVKADDYDAVVLVGGSGAATLFHDRAVHKLVRRACRKGKAIGAICLAPVILAEAGVLRRRYATVWDGDGKHTYSRMLVMRGAKYKKGVVVVDDRLVTANGPEAADIFASYLIKATAARPRRAAKNKTNKSHRKKPRRREQKSPRHELRMKNGNSTISFSSG